MKLFGCPIRSFILIFGLVLSLNACTRTNEERCSKNEPLIQYGLDEFISQTIETRNQQYYDCLKKTDLVYKEKKLELALYFEDLSQIQDILEHKQPSDAIAMSKIIQAVNSGTIDLKGIFEKNEQLAKDLLLEAVNNKDSELIQKLVKNINVKGVLARDEQFAQDLLVKAISNKDLELVKKLVKAGTPIFTSINGRYPINIAAETGYVPIVQFLTEQGVDISVIERECHNQWCGNSLYYAIKSGSPQTVSFILKQKKIDINAGVAVSVNRSYGFGQEKWVFPLDIAGSGQIAEILLKNHANPSICYASRNYGDLDTFKLLIRYHANVNEECQLGKLPLDYAYERQNEELIKLLLRHGAKRGWHSSVPSAF